MNSQFKKAAQIPIFLLIYLCLASPGFASEGAVLLKAGDTVVLGSVPVTLTPDQARLNKKYALLYHWTKFPGLEGIEKEMKNECRDAASQAFFIKYDGIRGNPSTGGEWNDPTGDMQYLERNEGKLRMPIPATYEAGGGRFWNDYVRVDQLGNMGCLFNVAKRVYCERIGPTRPGDEKLQAYCDGKMEDPKDRKKFYLDRTVSYIETATSNHMELAQKAKVASVLLDNPCSSHGPGSVLNEQGRKLMVAIQGMNTQLWRRFPMISSEQGWSREQINEESDSVYRSIHGIQMIFYQQGLLKTIPEEGKVREQKTPAQMVARLTSKMKNYNRLHAFTTEVLGFLGGQITTPVPVVKRVEGKAALPWRRKRVLFDLNFQVFEKMERELEGADSLTPERLMQLESVFRKLDEDALKVLTDFKPSWADFLGNQAGPLAGHGQEGSYVIDSREPERDIKLDSLTYKKLEIADPKEKPWVKVLWQGKVMCIRQSTLWDYSKEDEMLVLVPGYIGPLLGPPRWKSRQYQSKPDHPEQTYFIPRFDEGCKNWKLFKHGQFK